jgi:hypothetical protein
VGETETGIHTLALLNFLTKLDSLEIQSLLRWFKFLDGLVKQTLMNSLNGKNFFVRCTSSKCRTVDNQDVLLECVNI